MLANAFFVATEFALTRLPQFDRADIEATAGLQRAWEMTERLEIYLTGCQLGITTTSILLGIVAEPAVTALLHPLVAGIGITGTTASVVAVVLGVVLINLIHKIWGEQAPTYVGVERPIAIARYTATAHYWWTQATYPFILLGDGLAKWTLSLFGVKIERSWTKADTDTATKAPTGQRTELTQQMARLLRNQDVPADRREEVLNALEIGTTPLRDIMVPRDEVVVLFTRHSLEETRNHISAHPPHSRYPLVEGSLDDVTGIVYAPAIVHAWDARCEDTIDVAALATPALWIEATCPISEGIDRMQANDQGMAVVTDDHRAVGIVTITDAFEAIVGDMQDPFDTKDGTVNAMIHDKT